MRAAIETEATYAQKFPFVDYGCDLNVMSQLEKGVRIERFAHTDADVKLKAEEKSNVDKYLAKMKCRKYSLVPEKFHGKGPGGYMLYDWVWHKKRGAAKPSQNFMTLVMKQNTRLEHHIKDKLVRRSKIGGARWAMQALRNRK